MFVKVNTSLSMRNNTIEGSSHPVNAVTNDEYCPSNPMCSLWDSDANFYEFP